MHELIAVVVVHNCENEGFSAISSDRLGQAKTKVPSSLSCLSYASAATGTRGNVVMVTWVNGVGYGGPCHSTNRTLGATSKVFFFRIHATRSYFGCFQI